MSHDLPERADLTLELLSLCTESVPLNHDVFNPLFQLKDVLLVGLAGAVLQNLYVYLHHQVVPLLVEESDLGEGVAQALGRGRGREGGEEEGGRRGREGKGGKERKGRTEGWWEKKEGMGGIS